MKGVGVAFLLFSCFAAHPVGAANVLGGVAAAQGLSACFASNGVSDVCIGKGAEACVALSQTDTRSVFEECVTHETGQWLLDLTKHQDVLLSRTKAHDADRASLGQPAIDHAGMMRSAFKAWRVFRDRSCQAKAAFRSGGQSRHGIFLQCINRLTALRSMEVGDAAYSDHQ